MDGGRRGERGGGWRWSPRSSAYGDGRRLEVPARAALSGKGRGRNSTVSTQPCGDLATSSIKGVAYGGLLCHFHGNSASDGRGRVNRRRRRCAQPSAAAPVSVLFPRVVRQLPRRPNRPGHGWGVGGLSSLLPMFLDVGTGLQIAAAAAAVGVSVQRARFSIGLWLADLNLHGWKLG